MATVNPQLQELLDQVEALKALRGNLKKQRESTSRGKYQKALVAFNNYELPVMPLDSTVFTNASASSLQQQFNKAAEKLNTTAPSVCSDQDGTVYLINWDDENAEEAFENYLLKKAGISKEELYAITSELDAATR